MGSSFPRSTLKEVCLVMSSAQYSILEASEPYLRRKKKIEIDRKYELEIPFCRVSRTIMNDCFCVCSKDADNEDLLYYLTLVLDSSIGRVVLLQKDGKFSPSGTVSLKLLRDFDFPLPQDEIIKAGADLKKGTLLITGFFESHEVEYDMQYIEAISSVLREIIDCYVMELYSKSLFESYDIHIIDSWEDLLQNSSFSKNTSGAVDLLQAITASESALMTNVRRFRALLSDLDKIVKSSK